MSIIDVMFTFLAEIVLPPDFARISRNADMTDFSLNSVAVNPPKVRPNFMITSVCVENVGSTDGCIVGSEDGSHDGLLDGIRDGLLVG